MLIVTGDVGTATGSTSGVAGAGGGVPPTVGVITSVGVRDPIVGIVSCSDLIIEGRNEFGFN